MGRVMVCQYHEESGSIRPCLTEEMIMNPTALPGALRGWRRYRIEYGFECSCPEGLIYLPAHIDPDKIEELLNCKAS